MPHERLRPSFAFDEVRLKQLQQIVPEAFADGNIDWEVLKQSLGERFEDESNDAEHFGLFWPGKREARRIASTPSEGSLIPVKGEGINEEMTKNIFIEGENLEVLKLLQKSYADKIKMIYIDPPYNTGGDFIYDDNFTEPLVEYLKYTGQIDEEGKSLTTNKKAEGRFHSKWLSMMYPRIRLARNLLKEDGLIFISIDDNEVNHLRKICDEIFGEENYLNIFCWVNNLKGRQISGAGAAKTYEYILVYAKNIENINPFEMSIEKLKLLMPSSYKGFNYETESDEGGDFVIKNELYNTNSAFNEKTRPNLVFNIHYNFKTKEVKFSDINQNVNFSGFTKIAPKKNNNGTHRFHAWRWGKEKIIRETDDLKFVKDGEEGKIFTKIREYTTTNLKDLITDISTTSGTNEVKDLFNGKKYFDYPKPVELIKIFVNQALSQGIVLDFFAGSCTTAHAVLDKNRESEARHDFICIQLPELCDKGSEAYKAGLKNIAEIGKERIRRVIKKFKKESKHDFGFKVFKLEKSNFKKWQDYKGQDSKELTSLFKEHEIPLVDGWKPDNLLIEVMLQEGFPLDSEIAELEGHKKNAVMQVRSEFCEHKLLVCFEKKIYQETINALDIQGEDIFVCLDSALTDEQKMTLSDKGFLKTV
jgi:adenine-specific DNA-methyltransferase